MFKRVISGLIILAVLFAIVLVNLVFPFGMNLAVGILTVLMIYELLEVFKLHRVYYYAVPSLLFGFVLPLIEDPFWMGVYCCAYYFALTCIMLFFHEKIQFSKWASATALISLVTIAMTTLVGIRNMADEHGAFHVFLVIMASWVADAGAYFAGSFFGKHKLCPKLSPKKTIEGVFGGFFLNMLGMIVFGVFYNLLFFGFRLNVSYLSLILLGIFCTVISIIGDLFFSFIKRTFEIKDYGNIIPGHGGFLDRFDSVIFVSPFFFFFLQLLPIIKI